MRPEPADHGKTARAVNEIADAWAAVILDLLDKIDTHECARRVERFESADLADNSRCPPNDSCQEENFVTPQAEEVMHLVGEDRPGKRQTAR